MQETRTAIVSDDIVGVSLLWYVKDQFFSNMGNIFMIFMYLGFMYLVLLRIYIHTGQAEKLNMPEHGGNRSYTPFYLECFPNALPIDDRALGKH